MKSNSNMLCYHKNCLSPSSSSSIAHSLYCSILLSPPVPWTIHLSFHISTLGWIPQLVISIALSSASEIPFCPYFPVIAAQEIPANAIICFPGSFNAGYLGPWERKGIQNGSIQWSHWVLSGPIIPKQVIFCQILLLFLSNITPNLYGILKFSSLTQLFQSQQMTFLPSIWKSRSPSTSSLPPSTLKTYPLPYIPPPPSQKQLSNVPSILFSPPLSAFRFLIYIFNVSLFYWHLSFNL